MKLIVENLLVRFLRTRCFPFTVKDISCVLGKLGYKVTAGEITEFLYSNPYVFALKDNTYMSRAGAFTGAWFSIKPSAAEIKGNYLLPGHRCMPFVDGEVPSGCLNFVFNAQNLTHSVTDFAVNDVLPYFSLYGEEYVSQYLAADPACCDIIVTAPDFELPQRIKLTVIDMRPVYSSTGFQSGDSLLCRVMDWDTGFIEVVPLHERKENPFKQEPIDERRQIWYSILENALLDDFRSKGPGISIEDQLATVFFEKRKDLCIPDCGSIEKYLQKTKKIGIELYGVETRLWFKGQEVPAVGEWNCIPEDTVKDQFLSRLSYLPLPEYILDSYVADAMYEKKDTPEYIFKKIFPQEYILDVMEKKYFLLQIDTRRDILKEQYNRFADFEIGPIRHRMLSLYARVAQLMCELDFAGNGLALFPQQPLIILSQLFNHISHILDSLLHDASLKSEDIRLLDISIEGMEYNFEDISEELSAALNAYRKTSFSVIKNGT